MHIIHSDSEVGCSSNGWAQLCYTHSKPPLIWTGNNRRRHSSSRLISLRLKLCIVVVLYSIYLLISLLFWGGAVKQRYKSLKFPPSLPSLVYRLPYSSFGILGCGKRKKHSDSLENFTTFFQFNKKQPLHAVRWNSDRALLKAGKGTRALHCVQGWGYLRAGWIIFAAVTLSYTQSHSWGNIY